MKENEETGNAFLKDLNVQTSHIPIYVLNQENDLINLPKEDKIMEKEEKDKKRRKRKR
jgi:hypothetical protein